MYLGASGVFVSLGMLGAFLPGLPATPFLLLASFFLIRSSPRLHRALLRSRLLGPILVDWQHHGGVRRHVKVKAIVAVIAGVALTIALSGYSPAPSIGVALLAAVGVTVILRLPVARPPEPVSADRSD